MPGPAWAKYLLKVIVTADLSPEAGKNKVIIYL